MSATAKPTRRNREIEVLRGLAVSIAIFTHLPVLLPFHTEFLLRVYYTMFQPGSGVDLFFCISGFVVTRAFLEFFDRSIAEGRFWTAFGVFWIRRAFRLLPTAWFWVIAGLACSVVFNATGVFATPWENVRSFAVVVAMIGNVANALGGYLHPNDVYWSLALEEQFYVLFPFFLLLVHGRWRWIALLAFVAVQFPLNRNINLLTTPLASMLASVRLDGITWGVLVALFSRTPAWRQIEPTILGRSKALALVHLVGLLYLMVSLPAVFPLLSIAMGLVAVCGAALVLLASYDAGYVSPFPVITRVFETIGVRSYAIYIIHLFTFRVTFEAWSRHAVARGVPLAAPDTLPMLATALVMLALLVEANYRWIELPWREKGRTLAASVREGTKAA